MVGVPVIAPELLIERPEGRPVAWNVKEPFPVLVAVAVSVPIGVPETLLCALMAPTVTVFRIVNDCCTCDAAVYIVFPDWLASIMQVPAVEPKETVPALIVQLEVEPASMLRVTVSEAESVVVATYDWLLVAVVDFPVGAVELN